MYTIIKGLDGQFHCEGRLQDSTERWTEPTMAKAITSMKRFAKYGNHHEDLTVNGIKFLEEKREVVEQFVYEPMKRRKK